MVPDTARSRPRRHRPALAALAACGLVVVTACSPGGSGASPSSNSSDSKGSVAAGKAPTCGKAPVTSTNYWYDAHVIAEKFDPWMRHRYAVALYAVLMIALLVSQVVIVIVSTLVKLIFASMVLYLATLGWIVNRALT